jgi:hypothetical protein
MSINIRKRWREWRNSTSQASPLSAEERRAEASANRFKALEYASAAVVLLGIVGEYEPPFITALPRIGFRLALKSIWAGAAIALGIAGEISFSMLASSREKKVASIQAQRRTEAEQRTAEALAEAARANLLAEQERIARLRIEQEMVRRTVSRILSEDEARGLVTALAPFAGQKFQINTAGLVDRISEQFAFMMQLEAVLRKSGWIADLSPNTGPARQGIKIVFGGSSAAAAVTLQSELNSNHINAQGSIDPTLPLDTIKIFVGLR